MLFNRFYQPDIDLESLEVKPNILLSTPMASRTPLRWIALLHGIPQITTIERELTGWLTEHEYESVTQIKGSLSQKKCPEPAAFERAQYMKALTGYKLQN